MTEREKRLDYALGKAIEIIEGYNKRDERLDELDAIYLGKEI